MDLPQHVVHPREVIRRCVHINFLSATGEEVGLLLKVGSLLCCMHSSHGWKHLLYRFSEEFNPSDQIEELRDGKIGQSMTIWSANLLNDLVGTDVGDTGRPKHFDGPVRGEAGRYVGLDQLNLCNKLGGRSKDSGELCIEALVFIGGVGSLHVNTTEYL